MAAYPITIPGTSSRMDAIMSPNSISSPLSISSPYSAHSSLSNASNIGQTLASSFATSVTSGASIHSPKSENDVLLELGMGNDDIQVKMAPLSTAAAAALAASKKHKPHGCDVCGASFARKVHLQRHSLRHQVCKPYCCERCGKCFSRQDSLVRHHRLLHEKIKEKPKRSVGTMPKKKKDTSTCTRCNNIGTKCDGKTPCNRCSTSEYNAQQCNYKTASSSSSTSEKLKERRQSVSQMTVHSASSVFDDEEGSIEEEDMMSIAEESSQLPSMFASFGNGHGPRRYTVSNMETVASTMQNELNGSALFPRTFDDCSYQTPSSNWSMPLQQNLHPFEMPPLDTINNFMDIKSLHPQQLHQGPMGSHHQQEQQSLFESHSTSQQGLDMPLLSLFNNISTDGTPSVIPSSSISFDWTSLMNEALSGDHHNVNMMDTSLDKETLPFSKAASNKSLNVTLHRGPEDNSCFSSPAIFPPRSSYILTPAEQQQQLQEAIDAVTGSSSSSASGVSNSCNATINLASLGLPVPPNINISVPADLQMSAENWDNLMRCLTNMASSSRPAPEVAQ